MHYVNSELLLQRAEELRQWLQLSCEYGLQDLVEQTLQQLQQQLEQSKQVLSAAVSNPELLPQEPSDLATIRAQRPDGPRRLPLPHPAALAQRMEGAVLGRFAACLLGVPVEGWTPEAMRRLASDGGSAFPPEDYWSLIWNPDGLQYGTTPRYRYTRDGMDGVAVDDDITYTLVGLLILERYGLQFTTADVGAFWNAHLDRACTAEDVALKNLKRDLPIDQVGSLDNPYQQWIGADIRSDPWGWACAGNPELAAEFAWRDAYLSHRRGGIHGAMFFAAAQAAAFCTDSPEAALRIGLTEIPAHCRLAEDIRWALEQAAGITGWEEARRLVDARFAGMHPVHTNNNACLTVFGLMLGQNDFTRTAGTVVAMGLDNDCTAATAGSILGAIVGAGGIAPHWTRRFHNRVHTYIRGHEVFALDDVVRRFLAQVQAVQAMTNPSASPSRNETEQTT